jgi:pimeloyl-ACP methyl ester carboxylesterase
VTNETGGFAGTGDAGGRAVVLAPGGNYGPDAPLLKFAGLAAERREASLRPVEWDLEAGELDAMITARVSAAVKELTAAGATAPVIAGKSLGSRAAPVAAEHGLPAVWLTPLLTGVPAAGLIVAALRRATAPFLLIGGTADEWWDGDAARSLTPHVVEIEGADHGMFVPGPLAASAAVLGEVITAVERFLDDVVWPLEEVSA